EKELVDVIQPDTGRAGGITQIKKIAAMAEAHHIQMAPHSGVLGRAADLLRIADFDELAFVHDADTVAHVADNADVMT
ncbi:enolase C-terminal domain-like protein, partial [Rhizobium ruizarguesonis]